MIRAEKPTSAKVGSKAIITEEGKLIGWIGGSCAEPTVKREAKKALKDSLPRLIRLSPAEKLGKTPQEGVIEIPLTCISGGTLDIYIEPQLAQPHLVVIGHLATAEALVSLSKGMGWRVSLMGLDVERERFPDADMIFDRLDFSQLTITKNTYIVVASHGNYDEDMLVAALRSEVPYVALIASKTRSTAILQYLRESDLTAEQIARLKYPAGLDFGAVTPEEIALSILAEIVQRWRSVPTSQGESISQQPIQLPIVSDPAEAKDPVCGMMVETATAHFTSEFAGTIYYFCAAGCKRSFDKEPQKYIQPEVFPVVNVTSWPGTKLFNKENNMQLKGDVIIRAPRKRVWDFMTDPEQIGQCVPGVEKIEIIEPLKRYSGIVSVGFGAVKARFSGEVEILELDEPNHAKLKAHGSASGSVADAVSEMTLSDGPDGATLVHWTADVTIGGQLASLAARLMVPVSEKLAGIFYDQVRKKIETENANVSSAN